eukprot:2006844-Pyramimonas_sp.AAC.1
MASTRFNRDPATAWKLNCWSQASCATLRARSWAAATSYFGPSFAIAWRQSGCQDTGCQEATTEGRACSGAGQ